MFFYRVKTKTYFDTSRVCFFCGDQAHSFATDNKTTCDKCFYEISQIKNTYFDLLDRVPENKNSQMHNEILQKFKAAQREAMLERHNREIKNFDKLFKIMLESDKLYKKEIEEDKKIQEILDKRKLGE